MSALINVNWPELVSDRAKPATNSHVRAAADRGGELKTPRAMGHTFGPDMICKACKQDWDDQQVKPMPCAGLDADLRREQQEHSREHARKLARKRRSKWDAETRLLQPLLNEYRITLDSVAERSGVKPWECARALGLGGYSESGGVRSDARTAVYAATREILTERGREEVQ